MNNTKYFYTYKDMDDVFYSLVEKGFFGDRLEHMATICKQISWPRRYVLYCIYISLIYDYVSFCFVLFCFDESKSKSDQILLAFPFLYFLSIHKNKKMQIQTKIQTVLETKTVGNHHLLHHLIQSYLLLLW